jgi:hypothetical protein
MLRLFTGLVNDKMQSFKETGHLLIPMGNDFHFQQADINYRNMDKAIQTLLRPSSPAPILEFLRVKKLFGADRTE